MHSRRLTIVMREIKEAEGCSGVKTNIETLQTAEETFYFFVLNNFYFQRKKMYIHVGSIFT
jgi:hypothetical protein